MSEQHDTANDYALAKYLNEYVAAIFALIAYYHGDVPDLAGINHSYVLIVAELKKLYARNPELSDIEENICWRTFGTIDAIDPYDLYEYSDDYKNHGIQHISKVNSLCIIAGKTAPVISPELKGVLDEARKNIVAFADDWLIPEYFFEITEAGVLLVNGISGVMNVKKLQAGSVTEMVLTQAKECPNETFEPELKVHSTKRGLRTSLAEIGFTGALERLFFPVMENQAVKFRPRVRRAEANREHIDLTELDAKLKRLGAETVFDIYSLPL